MEFQLRVIGVLLVALAIAHGAFPAYFHWQKELAPLSPINRQMMYVHTFFIALVVLLMGILCLGASHELVSTPLGKLLDWGLGIFWFARLLVQFFGYSATLWKGKAFETAVHVVFTGLWSYLSAVFLYLAWFA
jgi:hypothetical protein